MTYYELLKYGETSLRNAEIEDAEFDAMQLILAASKKDTTSFWLDKNDIVDKSVIKKYEKFVARRSEGEPLQYIIGFWSFYKSEFAVGKGVLIPRPETEELVDICVRLIKNRNYRIIYDLCTGTGCIGLSIAKEFPDTTVYLFELFDDAIYYAKRNIEKLDAKNAILIKCDVLKDIADNIPQADLIISNPPYIATEEINSLQHEVLQEPHTALDGGMSGFEFYTAIFEKWLKNSKKDTYFAFECGEGQAEVLQKKYNTDFCAEIRKDVYGIERFLLGYKK